jgi:hypothetical protein
MVRQRRELIGSRRRSYCIHFSFKSATSTAFRGITSRRSDDGSVFEQCSTRKTEVSLPRAPGLQAGPRRAGIIVMPLLCLYTRRMRPKRAQRLSSKTNHQCALSIGRARSTWPQDAWRRRVTSAPRERRREYRSFGRFPWDSDASTTGNDRITRQIMAALLSNRCSRAVAGLSGSIRNSYFPGEYDLRCESSHAYFQ